MRSLLSVAGYAGVELAVEPKGNVLRHLCPSRFSKGPPVEHQQKTPLLLGVEDDGKHNPVVFGRGAGRSNEYRFSRET